MSKEVVEVMNANENLRHNEGQLVSRYDINLSLKHLAYFPYNISLNTWYPKAKDYFTYKNAVSLFEEKVNANRTCSQIGIKKTSCLCSWFEPVTLNEKQNIIQKEMMKLFFKYLIDNHINKGSCKANEVIEKIQLFSFPLKEPVDGADTLYKMEISTHGKLVLDVDLNFCLKSSVDMSKNILIGKKHPSILFWIKNERLFLQISDVTLPEKCVIDFCNC